MMTNQATQSTRLLNLFWYGITLAAFLLITIGVLLAVEVGQVDFGVWSPDVPIITQWVLALVLMGIGGLAGGLVRRKLLVPSRIAKLPVQGQPKSLREGADMRVRQAMFILLGLYETPAIILLGYTLATGEVQWLMLATAYMIILGVLAKPDFLQLVDETERVLAK